jgi:peptidyl-prolyl cis-trans isomerase B (cyclophilin B)
MHWALPSLLLLSLVITGCAEQPEKAAEPTSPAASTPTSSQTAEAGKPASPAPTDSASAASPAAVDPNSLPKNPADGDEVAVIETGKGRIIVMFYPQVAPNHVANFKELANKKFYDGTRFHRCIPGFMIQGGDPKSKSMDMAGEWGTGGNMVDGKEKQVMAEFSGLKHTRGVLSMARSMDPNSASSQFFLMHQDSAQLDGKYSAFGRIVSGQEVVDEIVKTGDPNNNGAVQPNEAVLVKTIRIATWPVK